MVTPSAAKLTALLPRDSMPKRCRSTDGLVGEGLDLEGDSKNWCECECGDGCGRSLSHFAFTMEMDDDDDFNGAKKRPLACVGVTTSSRKDIVPTPNRIAAELVEGDGGSPSCVAIQAGHGGWDPARSSPSKAEWWSDLRCSLQRNTHLYQSGYFVGSLSLATPVVDMLCESDNNTTGNPSNDVCA